MFARSRSAATGRLLQRLRAAIASHTREKLFAWAVFLGPEGTEAEVGLEGTVFDWARTHGVEAVPLCVLGDPEGPPGYALAPEAETTVLMFRRRRLLFHHAYRAGEWTPAAADAALKELPLLLAAGPGEASGAPRKATKVQPPPRPISGEGEQPESAGFRLAFPRGTPGGGRTRESRMGRMYQDGKPR